MDRSLIRDSNGTNLGEAKLCALRLAHDVGKYLARTARNLPDAEIPEVLVSLLFKDLFELMPGKSSLRVFEELANPLYQAWPDPRLKQCRGLLEAIEKLKDAVRDADDRAVRRAAEMALQVESLLLDIVKDLSEASP